MALVNLKGVSVGYGGPSLLLENVNLQIEEGERVGLLGRNGAGKTTLMKLINGDVSPDNGEIIRQQDVRVALLSQDVPHNLSGTIFEAVAGGLKSEGELLKEHHRLGAGLASKEGTEPLNHLDDIHQALDASNGWQTHQQVERVLSRLELNPDIPFENLSAGLKRRVLLARALVSEPDILMLDEPTNHLDLGAITWLEEFALRYAKTLLFVSHDRMFMQKIATRIIEIDRGNLTSWTCDYSNYLERKQAALDAETGQWSEFDKKLAREEIWVRQGIKARRTRNEGRVRSLIKMREERRARRGRKGTVKIQAQEADRSGKLVIEAEDLTYSYTNLPVIHNFSTTIMRGDKIGIIGPNGSGKSTLLQVLLGKLLPNEGNLRFGTKLDVAYFDQLREQLDEEKTVQENISEGNDTVFINGKPRHIISYLQDFLFSPDRARSPICNLSGGEKNRLLLARLFTRLANVLVMDEPTNDLDVETLELLEELLMKYEGTLLIVSHDRTFLNNVVTSTLVLEGNGIITEYIGGYDDMVHERQQQIPSKAEKKTAEKKGKPRPSKAGPRKLSYKEERELETLPLHIETLETEQHQLYQVMADPAFYQQENSNNIIKAKIKLERVEKELEDAYNHWENLEAIR